MKKKIFMSVIEDFGNEWEKFDNKSLSNKELKKIFNSYFKIFPKNYLNNKSVGIDIGSGSGRWAEYILPKVKKLYLLEPSKKAIKISQKKLFMYKNAIFINSEVKNIYKIKNKFDFAYSLGVIHHLNYPEKAFKLIRGKLKNNAPFLIYLYHNFENNNIFYKLIWKVSDLIRSFVSKQNFFIKSIICDIIAIFIYYPLAKSSILFDLLNFNMDNFPLSYYRYKPFYIMRNDSLDRFGTKYEKRYSRTDILKLFKKTGFKKIKVSKYRPYWCAVGYK